MTRDVLQRPVGPRIDRLRRGGVEQDVNPPGLHADDDLAVASPEHADQPAVLVEHAAAAIARPGMAGNLEPIVRAVGGLASNACIPGTSRC